MIKLIATDIDGTLIAPGNEEISKENIEAIHKLHDKNIIFVLATGRVFQGIKHLIPILGLDKVQSYAICNNGAQIFDLLTEQEIYVKEVQKDYLFELKNIIQNKAAFLLNQEKYAVMSKYNEYGIQHDHDKIDYDFYWPQDITKHFNEVTHRVMVTEKKEVLDGLEKEIREKLENKVSIARNNDIFLDITHIEADKGIALTFLASQLGIDMKDVIAAGDGGNDISMLQKVGIGLVLDNAAQYVKDAVGLTSIHAKDHIVEHVLKQYIN